MNSCAWRQCLLLCLLLALQPALRAAEAPSATGAQPQAAAPQDQTPAGTAATGPNDAAPEQDSAHRPPADDDVFVPSIETSEDTSVPFPVDI